MPPDATSDIDSGLRDLARRVRDQFATAPNEPELRAIKAQVLGKKGELTSMLRRLGEGPPAGRRAVGERFNGAKADVEREFEERLVELHRAAREAELNARPFDLSLPGRRP